MRFHLLRRMHACLPQLFGHYFSLGLLASVVEEITPLGRLLIEFLRHELLLWQQTLTASSLMKPPRQTRLFWNRI